MEEYFEVFDIVAGKPRDYMATLATEDDANRYVKRFKKLFRGDSLIVKHVRKITDASINSINDGSDQ